MPVTFHKMHGLGNDFVLLDLRDQAFDMDANAARRLADRHEGVGCDKVLVLRKPTGPQLAAFEVWNADGSRAEQCGNGVRCLGLYLDMTSAAPQGPFLLEGVAGDVSVECLDGGGVRVEMGEPDFAAATMPSALPSRDGWYLAPVGGRDYRLGAVSMGNPHALLIVDDVATADVAALGPAISTHPAFPEGCNAGFVEVVDRDNIRLRVYERGAAETLACGSGACAAVSILRRAEMVSPTVNVTQAGGVLIIAWKGERNAVIMTGPATHVFKGKLT